MKPDTIRGRSAGIHELHEETRGRDYNPEYVLADSMDGLAVHSVTVDRK